MPTQKQCQAVVTKRFKNPTKFKMNGCRTNIIVMVIILASLPYSSTLNLPSGDPAPGRSPGPPIETFKDELDLKNKLDTNIEVPGDETAYDEVTTNDEISTVVSESSVSERIVGDACGYARIPSDSDDIVTLSERDSDVNLTFSHSVFETDELVKGVLYDGKIITAYFLLKIK
ncbi:unnamed protein product [Euphydryas editha]|uniref:Uncharacterized protein n=1 Tax=Euphydryas editha TaxID=104508 RepID=A0AAU9TYD3_EUPED|nr:unnamed protein product [Euphydryas editha]